MAQRIKPGAELKFGIAIDGKKHEYRIAGTRSLQRLFMFLDGAVSLQKAIDTCQRELGDVSTETLLGEIRSVWDLFHPVGCAYLRKPEAGSST